MKSSYGSASTEGVNPSVGYMPVGSLLFACLWLLCLGSAFSVVYSTFESRKSIQVLESLRREENALRVESGQYQLEKSSLGSYPRVEEIARGELNMTAPKNKETILIFK
ncbi:MAG: cell division protein FtsL [Flavobacteriales bacterium]